MWVVDADDFCEKNSQLDLLKQVREETPEFKMTVFTVIGASTPQWLYEMHKHADWLDMVPHGWQHPHPRECEDWSYEKSVEYLNYVEKLFPWMTKGFKAPGWQISMGMYRALMERDWWVADQAYNNGRRPEKLRAYILDRPGRMHFHIGSWNNVTMANSLDEPRMLALLRCLKGRFAFVRDVV